MIDPWPNLRKANFIIRGFRFATARPCRSCAMHYLTIGDPAHPAVLLIHNTTGTAKSPLEPALANELFDARPAARRRAVFPRHPPDVIGLWRVKQAERRLARALSALPAA